MSEILTESSGGILQVTLNRPEKKNAMTSAMYLALAESLNNSGKEKSILVVLIVAAGDSFCAGNDMEDFLKNPPREGSSPQLQLFDALLTLDKPVVAAVKGWAVGIGTTLLTHSDFVYAAESAKFKLPFVDLALVPEFGSSWSLPARSGYARASELLMLGETFDAKHAAEIGLVTKVVPDEQLLAVATRTAEKLAAKPPGALQATKRLLKRASRESIEQAMKVESEEFARRVQSAEAREAFTAFIEKRAPDFSKVKT